MISSPPENLDLLEGLVRQLDNLPAAEAQIKVFTIVNGDAQSLSDMLKTLFTGQATGTAAGPQALMQLLQNTSSGSETSLVPLRFGVDTRTNSVIASGTMADLNIVEAILTKLDDGEVRHRKSVVIRLKNSPATDVATTINQFLTTERQILQQAGPGLTSAFEQIEREVVVVAEPVTNSLVLSATPKYFEEVRGIIEQLDARPPMVMIQVMIASVDIGQHQRVRHRTGVAGFGALRPQHPQQPGDDDQHHAPSGTTTTTVVSGKPFAGLQLQQRRRSRQSAACRQRHTNTNPPAVGGQGISNFGVGRTNSTLGYSGLVLSAASENVSAMLRALAENHRVDILQRPQIMTLDNQPAFIQVGQRVPRITAVSNNALTGNTNSITLDNVGLILGVTPRISPDGLVVMQIDAEKSELESDATGIPIFTSPTGQVIRSPIIDATTAQTTVAAMSEQTVVLGGLITKSESKEHHGVPVLDDIPVVNNFFRYDSTIKEKTELLIIMTPHIVKNQAEAEALKRTEAAKMSWCLSDVTEIYGEAGLRRRTDVWTDGEVPVIYPDAGPLPAGSQPAAPEVIPDARQPARRRRRCPRRSGAGAAGRRARRPAQHRAGADRSERCERPFPRAATARIRATMGPQPHRRQGVQPASYQPQPWQQGNAAQPAVYQAPVADQPARYQTGAVGQLPATAAALRTGPAAPTIRSAVHNGRASGKSKAPTSRCQSYVEGNRTVMNSHSQHRSYLHVCRLLAGLLLAAWLAPAARGDGWPYWPFNKDDKPGKPDKIITLWSDTVLTQAGRPPIRGFGGRLMFYEGKKEEPIKVEGTLVVYAFDETDRDANNARPDRKYVFTPQQLPLHYSKSKIGHSYSVWLPWDEVGGMQKEITLIVRFEPKEGSVAISDPCRQLLPGRIAAAQAQLPAGGVLAPEHDGAAWSARSGLCRPPRATARRIAAMTGGVQPVAYQAPVTEGTGALPAPGSSGDSRRQRSTCRRARRSARRSLRRRFRRQRRDITSGAWAGGAGVRAEPWRRTTRRRITRRRTMRRRTARRRITRRRITRRRTTRRRTIRRRITRRQIPTGGICSAGGIRSAGDAVCRFAWPATTIWFCTWSTVASRRTTRSAKSRSCSVAATPRRIAVRPCISTWTGPCQCSAGSARRCSAICRTDLLRREPQSARIPRSRWSAPLGASWWCCRSCRHRSPLAPGAVR